MCGSQQSPRGRFESIWADRYFYVSDVVRFHGSPRCWIRKSIFHVYQNCTHEAVRRHVSIVAAISGVRLWRCRRHRAAPVSVARPEMFLFDAIIGPCFAIIGCSDERRADRAWRLMGMDPNVKAAHSALCARLLHRDVYLFLPALCISRGRK